jgi:LacI family transcriptional regulator
VCGFDDTDMARSIWPELTTIRQPIREMTAWAVSALARMLRTRRGGQIRPEQETLPYTLVRRESDAAPPVTGLDSGGKDT